jgi:hypothetical protein
MATYVKVAGTWRTVTTDAPTNGVCGQVKVNGTWRTVNQSYVKINGTWRSTCTAPGQQPAAIPETICYRPNYCLNGTNGVILPTTEPCYLADGVSLGTRTAPYTCQTDPGCVTYTVPAGICTAPDPIIQVVSEEVGECEFWGGLSGCTSGYGKRVTKRYSDSSLKVSYNCCDPLQPNLKYYCTLRPFSTGTCLNELKSTDFTGTVVTGQGEWVCEALGVTSFPSCSTAENCLVPKSTSSTYEACGYLGTGQRLVTSRTFQSWCATTQDTIVGDCVGEVPKCGGAYCGDGSGEEEYTEGNCQSGTGIRYKCLTPEGCNPVYTFKRCTAYSPPVVVPGGPALSVTKFTEVCYATASTSSTVLSCRQYSAESSGTPGTNCAIYGTSGSTFIPCPDTTPVEVVPTCPTLQEYPNEPCTTTNGLPGLQTRYRTPSTCPDRYGPCIAVPSGTACCQDDDAGFCADVGADGYGTFYQNRWDPCTSSSCAPRSLGRTFCGVPVPQTYCPSLGYSVASSGYPGNCPGATGGTPPATGPDCNSCPYGSGVRACGTAGTQTWCITPVGCDNKIGECIEPTPPTTPTEPTPTNPGEIVIFPPDTCWFCDVDPNTPIKSVNVNTLVRTKSGLVAASDLKVGDKLLSADVESFPYDNLAATNMDLINWTAENPYVNLVETEVVGLRYHTAKWAVLVDSDIFSNTHYIMVKRGEITSFVKSLDLEPTDLIWSYAERTWLPISVLEKLDVNHEVVSIDCEPYDIFFTERMLTHDSNTVD